MLRAVLILMTPGPWLEAQVPRATVFARLRSGNVVEIIDPATGRGRPVYHSPRWATRDVSVSPDGGLLGLIEVEEGRLEGSQYRVPPLPELLVLDTAGAVVRRVAKGVQSYVWCGNRCLVYILGEYSEGDVAFVPESAFTYDVASARATPIPGSIRPMDLSWAPFDSSMYFKVFRTAPSQSSVYRYHVPTGTLSGTPHLDIHFSASGRYYVHARDDGDRRLRVYDAGTDLEVQLPELTAAGVPVRWVFTGPNDLLIVRSHAPVAPSGPLPGRRPPPMRPVDVGRDVDYAIFDVESRTIVRSLHGQLPPWSAPAGSVPFLSGGRISAISRP